MITHRSGYTRRVWNEDRYYAVFDRVMDAWEDIAGDVYELGALLHTAVQGLPTVSDPVWHGDREAVRAARRGILHARQTIKALEGGDELLRLEAAMLGR